MADNVGRGVAAGWRPTFGVTITDNVVHADGPASV
jgi:hypothetical protein